MAKEDSFLNLRGTFQGKTFVKSKTYGNHVRSPRGSVTPAELNDACKEAGKAIVKSNVYAKLVKDAVEPFRRDFKDGTFWSRLISHFSLGANKHSPDLLSLADFEVHKDYQFGRLISLELKVDKKNNETLMLSSGSKGVPNFRNKKINSYCLTVIVVYIETEKQQTQVLNEEFVVSMAGPIWIEEMLFPIPAATNQVLICAKIEGMQDGQKGLGLNGKGMKILKGMDLNREGSGPTSNYSGNL